LGHAWSGQSAGNYGQGGDPVSDDKPSRAEQHLINEARKHQSHQPQPPDKVTIGRVGRFNGMTSRTSSRKGA
jgi:hypothetical protein